MVVSKKQFVINNDIFNDFMILTTFHQIWMQLFVEAYEK
jgi:hypothetical protein